MTDTGDSPLDELEKFPDLLPTRSLNPDQFEDFVERLLHAHRFASDVSPRVVRVERWGRKGDKQDGIDFEGSWSDFRTAAWQCKRLDKLTPAEVHKFVKECTFVADSYYLTYSGEASSEARKAMAAHLGWELLDQRGLGRMLNELPLHRRRQVLDATWGTPVRKLLMRLPGEDSFMTVDDLIATRSDEDSYLNDLGPFIGRQDEIDTLTELLDPNGDWAPVVIVSGNGGAGKSRLMSNVLRDLELAHPELPVLWLTPGRSIDAEALAELPHTPAIIVVDDAHRDPAQLAPLLSYRKAVPGTRIVLGSRRAGQDPLRALLLRDGFTPAQIGEVELPDLTGKQAKQLVESLATGLDLPFELIDHLALKATDAPFVAVLAVNMIRRGELAGPLAMDQNLREVVMARYEELLVGAIGGFQSRDIRRLLATVAALGSVDLEDEGARQSLAEFVGLDPVDFLRVCNALDDAGVLITRGGKTRVVPDILADQVLEREAVERGIDTTFVRQLWAALGIPSNTTLVANLAALGWRLSQSGLPNVLDSVWESLKQHIAVASYDELDTLVGGLDTLAYTQPVELTGLLDALIERLDGLEMTPPSAATPTPEGVEEPASPSAATPADDEGVDEAVGSAAVRELFGLPPTSRADVERRLPRFYGRSAAQEPSLLEHALDKLWEIRARDSRPPHSYPEHAERVIVDDLADLGKLPSLEFPERIVEWTRTLLASVPDDWGFGSPLLALRPLVAKEGTRTRMSDRRTIAMEPYLVSAKWARPIRDRIRELCVELVGGQNRRIAGDAIRILREALQEPHGYFNQTIPSSTIDSWEEDDLATIDALASASRLTDSAAVRREIRRSLNWAAEYSTSRLVMHAALTLIHELDQDSEDDLVDWLAPGFEIHVLSMRGTPVPAIDELEPSGSGERSVDDIGTLMAESDKARAKQLDQIVESLAALPAADRLRFIADAVEDIHAVQEEPRSRVDELVRHIASRYPDQCQELVEALSSLPATVLDDEIVYLLQSWQTLDEPGLLTWLSSLPNQRREVRLGVARAFSSLGWPTSGAFQPSLELGWADSDQLVGQAFLAASHGRISRNPAAGIAELRANGATNETLVLAIKRAAGWKGHEWGASLDNTGASAVLEVLGASGWDDPGSITSGIASRNPAQVLDGLLADARAGRRLPFHLRGLTTVVSGSADLAGWLLANAVTPDASLFAVTRIALEKGITSENAAALSAAVGSISATQLSTLVAVLRHCPLWPVSHPELAKRILARVGELKDPSLDDAVELVRRSMTPNGYGWTNGRSPELEHAWELVRHLRRHEADPVFHSMLSDAAEEIRNQIEHLRLDEDDD